MKIVEIIPHLKSGGAEKFVVDLSTSFANKGCEVHIVTLYNPSEDDLFYSQISKNVNKKSLGKKFGRDWKTFLKLLWYIRKESPDVVHLHIGAIKYSLLAALSYKKCKYYATIHSEAKREAGTGIEKYVRKFLFGTGLVTPVTISEKTELSFENFYGYKAEMILNGSSPYVPKDNSELVRKYHSDVDFLFVHVGRLHPVKNQKMLIEAIEQLSIEGYKCRLLILGRGEPGEILDFVTTHVSKTIVYVGEVPNVRDYMAISDCFCLSSHQEGLPITLLEAFSVGCPAVTTPVGGCVNVVKNGLTGYLSKDNGIEAYTLALRKILQLSKEQRIKMRAQCKTEYEEHFSINKCSNSYIELFKKYGKE